MSEFMGMPQSKSSEEEVMTPELAAKIDQLKKEVTEIKEQEVENMGVSIGQLQVEAMEQVVNKFKEKEGALQETSLEELKQIKNNVHIAMEDIASKRQGMNEDEVREALVKLGALQRDIEEAKDEKVKAA